jgi:BlaI family penicillinase repressor
MPGKRSSDQLTPLELALMKVLWETGPASVQTVQQHLRKERDLAYTTVQTMLNVLHRKGKVKRTLKNRAYHYRPVVSRQKAVRHAVRDMIDRFFGGSAETLVMSLIESRHLTPERLAKLNKLLEQSEEKLHGNH